MNMPGPDERDAGAVRLQAGLSFLAACAIALAVVLDTFAATFCASAGLVALALSFASPRSLSRIVSETRLAAALICVALIAALVPVTITGFPRPWLGGAVPLVVVPFAVAHLARNRTPRHPFVIGAAVLAVTLVAGAILIRAVRGTGLDVVQLHVQAAHALERGENPYGPAVSVMDGSPDASAGSRIVGYTYPPVVAAAFAVSTWLWGDPRWTSLLCWTVIALCGLALLRAKSHEKRSLLPLLLLAALPGWATMLQSGWTELLSAALLALAIITWDRPVISGIALGAALGSKQYFIVTLPLIALYRDRVWQRRAVTTVATGLVTVLPAFLWSASDAWRSLVLFHLQTPLRPDSANLVGMFSRLDIRWSPPLWIGLCLSLAAAGLLGRRASGPGGFCRAMAAGLGVSFMFARQAMPNYWFLVATTAALGSYFDSTPPPLHAATK